MKSITIDGELRTDLGSTPSNKLRKEERVPCVLYGGEKNVSFSAAVKQFKKLVYSPEFYRVDVKIGGDEYSCIMKDIQFHPTTDHIMHIDFQELTEGKHVITEIPVQLTGLAEGVKEGGRQILKIRKLKTKVLPKDLMEHIEINVTELGMNQSIKVGDLNISGYEFLNSLSAPIVTVETIRAMKEDRILEAEAEALAEEEAAAAALIEGEEGEEAEEGAEEAEAKKEEAEEGAEEAKAE